MKVKLLNTGHWTHSNPLMEIWRVLEGHQRSRSICFFCNIFGGFNIIDSASVYPGQFYGKLGQWLGLMKRWKFGPNTRWRSFCLRSRPHLYICYTHTLVWSHSPPLWDISGQRRAGQVTGPPSTSAWAVIWPGLVEKYAGTQHHSS